MFMQKLSFLLCIHLLSATDFYDDLCNVTLKAHEVKKYTFFPIECQVELIPKGVMITLENPKIKSIHRLINGLILQTQKNIKSEVNKELNKQKEKQLLNEINEKIKHMEKMNSKYNVKRICLDNEATNFLKTQDDLLKNTLLLEKKNLTCKLNEKEEIEYKKRKVALCIIQKHYNVNFCDIAPILKDIISRDDKDWKPDNLYPGIYYIINDISAVKSENEYETRLKEFINTALYVEFYFYDKFSIENFEVIYTNFSYTHLYFNRFEDSRIVFMLDLKYDIENYLVTFEEVFRNYLKGYEKELQIFTYYETVEKKGEKIQHIKSINRQKTNIVINNYQYPIQHTFELMDKDTTENMDCDKRLKIVDTLDDAELNISLYKERNDATDKLLRQKNINTEFKYLIEIKIKYSSTSKEYREECLKCLLIFNDETTNYVNIKKRKIYVCMYFTSEEYSYLIDENEKFFLANIAFENIKEAKRAIDLLNRIKVELTRFIYSPRKWLNYKPCGWADWRFSDYPLDRVYYNEKEIKTIIASTYDNVLNAIQALRKYLNRLNFFSVKPFLFDSEFYFSKNQDERRNDTCLKSYSLFEHIITTDENIQQQRYSDSYGFRLISNTYNCKHEYLIYILPSFIDELKKIDNSEIFNLVRKKLIDKTGIFGNIDIEVNVKFNKIILYHYAFIEMIDNLIFFIYLDENEKINLIKSILEQIFLDENHIKRFTPEIFNQRKPFSLQWQSYIIDLSNELVKIINEELNKFLKNFNSVELTIMFLFPKFYFENDLNEIKRCVQEWHNNYNLQALPKEEPEEEPKKEP